MISHARFDDQIRLSRQLFPTEEAAYLALTEVYRDKYPILLREDANAWHYRIGWPTAASFYVDPALPDGLQAFAVSEVGEIGSHYRLERWASGKVLFCLSLSHAWALRAWSAWLRTYPRARPTIIHLDDHADLMAPSLHATAWSGRFRDPTGSVTMRLSDPTAVASMIRRGLVGIGSFITPFLHGGFPCDLVHVCAAPYAAGLTTVGWVRLGTERLATVGRSWLEGFSPTATVGPPGEAGGTGVFQRFGDVMDLQRLAPEGPVLLDIDLDFFANRYNRDSDWQPLPSRDPPLAAVLTEVDRLAECLTVAPFLRQVEVITLAISPGFFPAEYWRQTVARLRSHLRRLLGGR